MIFGEVKFGIEDIESNGKLKATDLQSLFRISISYKNETKRRCLTLADKEIFDAFKMIIRLRIKGIGTTRGQ